MILKAFAPKRRCVITLTDVDGKRARTEAHLARRGGFSLGKKRLVAWNRKDCSGLLAVVGREVVWRFPRRMGGEGTTVLRLRGSEGPEVGGRRSGGWGRSLVLGQTGLRGRSLGGPSERGARPFILAARSPRAA